MLIAINFNMSGALQQHHRNLRRVALSLHPRGGGPKWGLS